MSGKIEVIIRKGTALRKDLNYYPYWSWKIIGEDGVKTIITPKWDDILEALKETIKHELRVDDTLRMRKPDTRRYTSFLNKLNEITKKFETDLNIFTNIPDIYTKAAK